MKTKALIIGLLALAGAASGCAAGGGSQRADANRQAAPAGAARQSATPAGTELTQTPASAHAQKAGQAPKDDHGHSHGEPAPGKVPAFQTSPASLKNLPPMLSPERFSGKQQLAYRLAREIPETIAQLPCFCYCDEGMGHKSLHSCFEDEHAAHCAICMDEAITAHKLQKEEKLNPEQIRRRIIAQYGS